MQISVDTAQFFHPSFSLTIPAPQNAPKCQRQAYILMALPRDAFFDVHQLRNTLQVEFKLFNEADLEVPVASPRALPSALILKIRAPRNKEKIVHVEVPMHLRYQMAVIDGDEMFPISHVDVHVPMPLMGLSCLTYTFVEVLQSGLQFSSHIESAINGTIEGLSSANPKNIDWTPISSYVSTSSQVELVNRDSSDRLEFEFQVPTGASSELGLEVVQWGTVATTVIGAMILLWAFIVKSPALRRSKKTTSVKNLVDYVLE